MLLGQELKNNAGFPTVMELERSAGRAQVIASGAEQADDGVIEADPFRCRVNPNLASGAPRRLIA
jgi:hypothetical protein